MSNSGAYQQESLEYLKKLTSVKLASLNCTPFIKFYNLLQGNKMWTPGIVTPVVLYSHYSVVCPTAATIVRIMHLIWEEQESRI